MHCTVQRARTALHYTVHSTRAALYTYRRIVRIVHIPYTVRTVQPRDYRPRGTIREGALLFSAREWLDFYSGGASIRGGLLFARIRYLIKYDYRIGANRSPGLLFFRNLRWGGTLFERGFYSRGGSIVSHVS